MLSYFAKKFIYVLLLLVAVTALSYTLISLSPVDPVSAYIGPQQLKVGPEQREAIAQRWGLDKSPVERFGLWLKNVLQGDWGESLIYREAVSSVVAKRFWPSLYLMGGALILSGVLGFVLGALAGFKEGSWLDKIISFYAYLMASTPTFWLGIILLTIFAVVLGWAPICCALPPGVLEEEASLGDRLRHLALPILTLSVVGLSAVILHTRQKVIDLMQSDFAIFAAAQGESPWGFLSRQGLRHILVPAITIQLASFGELFGGSILAEQIFSYPGLGKAAVEAGLKSDVPLLLGLTIASALFIAFGNSLADLGYRLLDPRLSFKKEGQA